MARKKKPLHRYPGQPPKHAGRLLARVLAEGRLDQRTAVARALRVIEADLAADRGGLQSCSAAERIAIGRAAFLTVLCESIERWTLQHPPIKNGELSGPVRKGYATHLANLVRTLAVLGMRPDREANTVSLAAYLTERRNDPADVPESAQSHENTPTNANVHTAKGDANAPTTPTADDATKQPQETADRASDHGSAACTDKQPRNENN